MPSVLRSVALLLLLYGSVLPDPGINPVLLGGIIAAPLIVWEFLDRGPKWPAGATFALGLLALLLVHPVLVHPPETLYGQDKLHRLYTVTAVAVMAGLLIRDRAGVYVFARVTLVTSVAVAGAALLGHQAGIRSVGFEGGPGDSPIGTAQLISVGIVCAVWMAWERRLRPPFALVLVALMAAGVFATGSRGPLIAAVVGIVALAITEGYAVRRLYVLCIGAVVAAAAFMLSPTLQQTRVGMLLTDPSSDGSFEDRKRLWAGALDAIPDHPGGVGLGNYEHAAGVYTFNSSGGHFLAQWPHNLFLELFVEHGWIVGAIFLAVVVRVVVGVGRAGRRGDPEARLLLALIVVHVLFASASGDLSSARALLALLVVGYSVVLARRDRDKHPRATVGRGALVSSRPPTAA